MSIVRFEVLLLEAAEQFLEEIDPKAKVKILKQLRKSTSHVDPKIFKKLDNVLWEFRVEFNRLQYRLLAFWHKKENKIALVVTTHGFIKKTDKVPGKEFERAYRLRSIYLAEKDEQE